MSSECQRGQGQHNPTPPTPCLQHALASNQATVRKTMNNVSHPEKCEGKCPQRDTTAPVSPAVEFAPWIWSWKCFSLGSGRDILKILEPLTLPH